MLTTSDRFTQKTKAYIFHYIPSTGHIVGISEIEIIGKSFSDGFFICKTKPFSRGEIHSKFIYDTLEEAQNIQKNFVFVEKTMELVRK